MTYEDPRTGRERNLGQDNVGSSVGPWVVGLVILAAVVFAGWYYYGNGPRTADLNKPASTAADNSSTIPAPQQSSGPGVQGPSGSTNGPAMKPAPNAASTGASTGTSGSEKADPSTQPSQDATGVKGAIDGKNGPTANPPSNP